MYILVLRGRKHTENNKRNIHTDHTIKAFWPVRNSISGHNIPYTIHAPPG